MPSAIDFIDESIIGFARRALFFGMVVHNISFEAL